MLVSEWIYTWARMDVELMLIGTIMCECKTLYVYHCKPTPNTFVPLNHLVHSSVWLPPNYLITHDPQYSIHEPRVS